MRLRETGSPLPLGAAVKLPLQFGHFLLSYEMKEKSMSVKSAKFTAREIALAKEFAKYENKWVAVVGEGKDERVVASGNRITDAKAAADKIGIKDPIFMKIPSRGETFIAGTPCPID